jgi:UV DNA damage endonuclease
MSRHRLGFAVKVLSAGGLPSHDTRRWQAGPHLRVSLERLEAILERIDELEIRMYRMSSQLAPYASHPDLPQFHRQIEECAERLAAVGADACRRDIRLSLHPGQYTVLNSTRDAVRAAAVAELEVQAALLDGLGQPPEAVAVVHVGGAEAGVAASLQRFARGFEKLSDRARARLVIENDDRSFDLSDVLELHRMCGVPVVWDVLHHRCLDREAIPDDEALGAALSTWPVGVTPKIHLSSPRLDITEDTRKVGRRVERRLVLPALRAHADLIDPVGIEALLRYAGGDRDFDIMLEAKGKDLALLALRRQLAARGLGGQDGFLSVPASTAAVPSVR